MRTSLASIALLLLTSCDNQSPSAAPPSASAGAAPAVAEPAAPAPTRRPDGMKTVVDVALGSPDHTTLVAALKAGDLVESLDSPGGVYTVFAPTNAAFDRLPKGTVEGLLKPEKKADLRKILQHHAAVPILQLKDMHDGETFAMADGTKVTFHVKGGKVMVENANILASLPAANGIVHVVDAVLLPR